MMLQGHFITLTFAGYDEMKSAFSANGSSGNILFDFWLMMRGMTAPLFFTIAGVVFLYVLTGPSEASFWKQKRVRKGLKRGLLLIILGYSLQLSVKNISLYLAGSLNERFFAFHVLNSIGLGIILLTFIYGVSRYFKFIPLHLLLLILSIIIFSVQPLLNAYSDPYFPANSPRILQNLFRGPHSVFPIIPWYGYLFAGGAIGVLFRKYQSVIHNFSFRFRFLTISLVMLLSCRAIYYFLGYTFPHLDYDAVGFSMFRLIQIIGVIALLMWLETKFDWSKSIVAVVGQNTLAIYFIHAILLYGAISGIGIKTWTDSSLSGFQSITGAIVFLVFFIVMTMYQRNILKAVRNLSTKLLNLF